MKYKNLTTESLSFLFKDYQLGNMSMLDICGKDGEIQTCYFVERCKNSEIWEIENQYIDILKNKFKNAIIKQRDSIKTIIEYDENNDKKYDCIILDCPLMIYCDQEYCEHFEVLEHIKKLFTKDCLILINIVTKPYNAQSKKNMEWLKRRKLYYGFDQFSIEFATKFYAEKFEKLCLKVNNIITHPREYINDELYLYHMLIDVSKI